MQGTRRVDIGEMGKVPVHAGKGVFFDIFYSDHKRRVDVHPAPDPPHRLAHALHYPPLLQRLDPRPRRLEDQLHLSLYPVRLQPLQRYHLVASVHWGQVSRAGERAGATDRKSRARWARGRCAA